MLGEKKSQMQEVLRGGVDKTSQPVRGVGDKEKCTARNIIRNRIVSYHTMLYYK